ncbi:hypothetical protein N7445_006037 [Penicillium cf. griseofulvum]|nr:hypothetical protein N7445_006037 [Penicillium cf. griseofulvum]
MGKDTGEATLTQLDATVNELPSATMSVSCEGLGMPEVEFGFGLRRATLDKEAWMHPHRSSHSHKRSGSGNDHLYYLCAS